MDRQEEEAAPEGQGRGGRGILRGPVKRNFVDGLVGVLGILVTRGDGIRPVQRAARPVLPDVFLGQVLNLSGGSKFFTGLATAAMGQYRGGSAKIAVIASSLFGSISGSAVSNVASTGVVTIPLMRDSGYTKETAGAFDAVASTRGHLLPPLMGAPAFVLTAF